MKCRCGHGRQWHRRASGKKRLPCQVVTYENPYSAARRAVKCKCRDFVQVER